MSKEISITLRLIQQHEPYDSMWKTLIKAHGGVKADLDRVFPLSSVLISNSFEDVLWCFRCLPKHKDTFIKFTLFLIKHAERYTNDKRVPHCKAVIRKYLRGEVNTEELDAAVTDAYKASDTACSYTEGTTYDVEASYEAAEMSAYAVYCAGEYIAGSDDAIEYIAENIANAATHYTKAINYAINEATNNAGHAVTCTFGTPTDEDIASITTYEEERQKQRIYLRKLLDGEI